MNACNQRFAYNKRFSFHVNDGKSLDVVPNGEVTLAFSFDSLVHAEAFVIESYVNELARKLSPDGVAFIHHSNLGAYEKYFAFIKRIPRGRGWLVRRGLIDDNIHWRGADMSAEKFRSFCTTAGLTCITQELINLAGTDRLMDCISVATRRGSRWDRPLQIHKNHSFMKQAEILRSLAKLYL